MPVPVNVSLSWSPGQARSEDGAQQSGLCGPLLPIPSKNPKQLRFEIHSYTSSPKKHLANKREGRGCQGRGRAKHIGPEVGSRHRWRKKQEEALLCGEERHKGLRLLKCTERGLWGADEGGPDLLPPQTRSILISITYFGSGSSF